MSEQDIRWQQRFVNYQKALAQLQRFVAVQPLNEMEQQGLVKAFEYTHELAWKVMKDYLEYEGATHLFGSRTVLKAAFAAGLIDQNEAWVKSIEHRNLAAHTYNEQIAMDIISEIKKTYLHLFETLAQTMLAMQKT